MKYWSVILLTCCLQIARAQPFTAGYLGGTGFSDFHGYNSSGRWQSKTGTLTGIFFRYEVSPVFSVGAELNYTSQGYCHKTFGSYYSPVYYEPWSSSYTIYHPYVYYTPIKERWDYEFLRVPFYITLSTPTRLQFSVSAGVFVSFITGHDYTGPAPLPYQYSLNSVYPVYGESGTPKHDNGLWYAASLSYPVSEVLRIYAQGRYAVGHKSFVASGNGRTGVSEAAFGLAYTGVFKSTAYSSARSGVPDSSFARFFISPGVGVSVSWVRKSNRSGAYGPKAGGSAGVRIEYRLDRTVSVVSGLGFERKGYRMKDSTACFYRYAATGYPLYKAETRVDLDYAILPLLLKIRLGTSFRVYLEGGLYAGFNLNARVTGNAETESFYESGYSKQRIEVYDDIEGQIKNFEVGWMCGTGIEVPLWSGYYLNLGADYSTGEKNLFENTEPGPFSSTDSDDAIRNGSLNIQLGITLPIIGKK